LLPSGLIVQQQYYAKKLNKYKPHRFSNSLLNFTTLDKNLYNEQKQIRALMPNLVHSLDANTLALVIDKLCKNNIKQFYSIHDCFAVTCNNVDMLMNTLKNVYTDIYTNENYLKDFDTQFLNYIKVIFGKECYDPMNNTITITINDEPIIINYPDINKVINNYNNIEFNNSSYIIH
jgi:DNA-directed RNA polymerase